MVAINERDRKGVIFHMLRQIKSESLIFLALLQTPVLHTHSLSGMETNALVTLLDGLNAYRPNRNKI